MRPIKFRGKHINDESVLANEWVYGDLLHKIDGVPHIHQIETDSYFEIYPETVGQLIIPANYEHNETGFDFYEGDIVDEFGVLRELKFEICDDTQGFDVNLDFWQCKVVGNIHNNPELLK